MKSRTNAYRFTINLRDGKPATPEEQKALEDFRATVSACNKISDRQMYVKLQGRGPRRGVRRYNQSLPLPLSERADVYVYDRRR
jgi:hypothetical protein